MSAGMPFGPTSTNQPSMVTPGTVSLMVGISGNAGKRCEELMASQRSLPACTMAFEAAIARPSSNNGPARLLGRHVGEEQLRRRARLIQDLARTVVPLLGVAATAIGSLYTGLKGILG